MRCNQTGTDVAVFQLVCSPLHKQSPSGTLHSVGLPLSKPAYIHSKRYGIAAG